VIFGSLVAAGFGAPIPEELPVITGGALAGHAANQVPREHPHWWILWPICIAGVVIADGILYCLGRFGGRRLLEVGWVRRHLLPPEKREQIENNFHKYGVRILLGARFLPGIRAPIFVMSGVLHMPVSRFLLADGLYAIPGVSALFFISFWFTDSFVAIFHAVEGQVNVIRNLIVLLIIAAGAGYFVYAYKRRSIATGDPHEIPLLGSAVKPAEADQVPQEQHDTPTATPAPPDKRDDRPCSGGSAQ
jgi:membrane protein DedA with SNARE-associated domain